MKQPSEAEMLHRAAAWCSAAERCIRDVEGKIAAAGLPAEVAERIIARLVEEKFIDEARYCRSFVNDKFRLGKWGRIKTGYELRRKNLPEALYSEALAAIDEEEYRSLLLSLLKGKKETLRGKDDREVFAKLFRFAAGRGFESELIIRCLHELDLNQE